MKNFKSSELNVLWTNEILSICFSLAFMIKSYGELPMILIILFALLIIIFLGFEGNLGAVFFYNTDLSTDQVVSNYNATKSRYGH